MNDGPRDGLPDKEDDDLQRLPADEGPDGEPMDTAGTSAADGESPDPTSVSQPKQPVLGDYVLLKRIGSGGMGRVFKAQHRRMDRLVALKMLPASSMRDTGAVQRFRREVKAAALLFHPNIVAAFDAGEQNGIHYLVMEYIDGQPLSKLVEQHGPLAADKAADYILQAGRGLEYAHSRGLIHRDVKPSNLILDGDGTVKILDLGTARFGDAASNELTRTGEIMGTVDYMSPEQARAAGEVDHRTDIYSLGCTMFYLLVGRPMYEGDMIQTLLAHAREPIPSLRDFRPDVPEWMDAVFHRLVAKRADQRYETVSAVIADLEEAGAAARRATPDTPETSSPAAPGRLASISKGVASSGHAHAKAVGIDLGTTYCSIAYLDKQGVPQTVLDSDGQAQTPAAVLIDGMNVVVGYKALRTIDRDHGKVALDVKRTIGSPVYPKTLGDSRYPPEALTGLLLARLADEARRKIGDFRQVVVSVPAYFDEVRRKSVQDAGYIAGLEVVDIINEPIAAAVSQGFAHDFLKPPGKGDDPVKMVVLDLGGGVLDVTVMDVEESSFHELASAGDLQLGGRDWDNRLVNLVAEHCRRDGLQDPRSDPSVSGRLWLQCERAKRMLSDHDVVAIDCRLESGPAHIELDRHAFETATRDLTDRVRDVVNQAVESSGISWSRIDRVLLAGGASRMPMIRSAVLQAAKRKLTITDVLGDAVAHGAALYAGARQARQRGAAPAFQIATVNAHSLGVVGINRRTGRRHNAILIPKNTQLPVTSKSTFKTQRQGQESVVVQIIQGEDNDPDACTSLGKCVIENLPGDLPAGSLVHVEFQYAANGRLTVYVESAATGYRATKEIERSTGLSNQALSRWREWVETIMLCSNFL
jgi:molecular chaperone DnaK (HSP70)